METKVVAFYLPQYHEVTENNKWWGEGFTEWTNVKNAKSLFEGHYQPIVPLDKNYYDLMDVRTQRWQTKLALKYGVDGFAYYHYWFDGKLLLQKPAENLLRNIDIKQQFFFFWANHTWYKTQKGMKSILQEQVYGGKDDWIKHYEYFRSFFKDNRYMKIYGKPILGIYIPEEIPDYSDMIQLWKKLACEDGFGGIYIVESCNSPKEIERAKKRKCADSILVRQPNCALEIARSTNKMMGIKKYERKFCRKLHLPYLEKYTYEYIMQLEKDVVNCINSSQDKDISFCISSGWDNTSRHGKYGQVIVGADPYLFGDTLKNLWEKSLKIGSPLLFVNAWNEWSEGMMLEPDEKYMYGMLEQIKKVKGC